MTSDQLLRHQHLIVIAAVDLEPAPVQSVLDETERLIEPSRRRVLADHGQLENFHALTRPVDHRLDEPASDAAASRMRPDEHCPEKTLVGQLGTVVDAEAGD